MRVALVSGVPLKNQSEIGAAYYTRALADELHREGVDVEVWAKNTAGEPASTSAPVLPIWRPGWFAWLDILKALGRRKPDVLHIQHSMFVLGAGVSGEVSMLVLLFALWLLRTRVVITCHDIPSLEQITPEYVRLHRYKYPAWVAILGLRVLFTMIALCARVVIVHQEAFARTLEHDFHVDRAKLVVVPHLPIPYHITDKRAARASLGIGSEERVLLFFGFATGYKGIDVLLEGMRRNDSAVPVRLVLGAGEHPKVAHTAEYRAYYQDLRERAAQTPGVQFAGFLPDERVDEYIDAADAAIFPYVEFQGMSGPLNQCASHDKAFLVSERIAEKVPGLRSCVFPPEPEAVAGTIRRFFSDDAYRSTVEEECRRFGESVLHNDFLNLTLRVYERALA